MTTKVKMKHYVDSTLLKKIKLVDSEGKEYTPSSTDKLVFHITQEFDDPTHLLEKVINTSDSTASDYCVLYLKPTDFDDFPRNGSQEWIYGEYYYDIHWETVSEEGFILNEPLQIGKFVLLNKVVN